uniref:HAT C-terminal dimerisation domain-containing protein n=1 Tax=Ditylenchus dipsaci TaxID=166011 RepID=A0A915EMK2_9BILA
MSYYNMVEALLKHRNQLLAAVEEHDSSNWERMFELLNRGYWKNYIKVLKPVADMVLDLQYFPHLAALARNFLAVQASSASSERAFKELRSIMGDFTRNRLDSKKVAALIHLRILYLKEIS